MKLSCGNRVMSLNKTITSLFVVASFFILSGPNAFAKTSFTGGDAPNAIGHKIIGKSIEIKGDYFTNGGTGNKAYGVYQRFSHIENTGSFYAFGGSGTSACGYFFFGDEFNNKGKIYAEGGNSLSASGFRISTSFFPEETYIELKNNGDIEATGGSGQNAPGIEQNKRSLLMNNGSITAIGGSIFLSCGYNQNSDSSIINSERGKIKAIGGKNRGATGFIQSGTLLNEGEIVATATISIEANIIVGASGLEQYASGTLINKGNISAIGGTITLNPNLNELKRNTVKIAGFIQNGTLINEGTIDVQGGNTDFSYGFYQRGALINKGKINIKDGTEKGIFGFYLNPENFLINNGTIHLVSTFPLNAFDASSNLLQTGSCAKISGNLASFIDFDSTGIIAVAPFLSKNILEGIIEITDIDLSIESQEIIKEAIYNAGVSRMVSIGFGGIGNKKIDKKSKFGFF